MNRTPLPLMAAFFLLAACASAPVYAPAAGPRAAGYSETQIETNRFFITYRAPSAADPTLLQDYALLRAADLTLANGRDWFWVDRSEVDESQSGGFRPSIGVGIGSWGRHVGGGVSVNIPVPLGGSTARAIAARLEIRFGEGVKPDAANTYDARAIAANLRARLQAPR